MSYSIHLTDDAIETYNALSEQLRIDWGNRKVDDFAIKVSKCLELLSQSPYLFAIYHKATGMRRCVVHRNVSMLYVIEEPDVLIICFWDNRQDPLFSY